jgi:hypothetical protein
VDTWKLRILHISDLQEGHPHAGPWRERRALGPAWARNLDVVLEEGPVDLVCFTGDVASRGSTEEFAQATGFFEELLQKLALPRERLFLVPGNHDVDRTQAVSDWQALRKASTEVDPSAFSQWLAGSSPPPGLEASARDRVLSRLSAYRTWLGAIDRRDLLPENSPHRYLGFRRKLRLPGQPFDIHICRTRYGLALWRQSG